MVDRAFGFLLFGEDSMHWETVSCWTDTILRDTIDWLRDQPDLRLFREWLVGPESRLANRPFVRLGDVKEQSTRPRLRRHGDMGKTPWLSDEKPSVDRLLYASLLDAMPDVVFLCRDTDDDLERREAARRAAASREWPFRVVLAIAQPEMEAWRIATGTPDANALAELARELGINPTTQPDELSSGPQSRRGRRACWLAWTSGTRG